MSDVSDEARSLFDAGRTGHEPGEDDRERVLRGVLVRTGIVATTVAAYSASASAAAGAGAGTALVGGASSSGLIALGLKLVLGLALVGSAGAGIYHFSRGHSTSKSVSTAASVALAGPQPVSRGDAAAAARTIPESRESTEHLEGVAAPTKSSSGVNGKEAVKSSSAGESQAPTSPRGLSEADAVLEQAPATAAFPDQAPTSVAPATSAPKKSGDASSALSGEARALADVQRALREGRNSEALTLVEQQQQRFAGGELGQERQAAKIVALCAVGRVAEARSLAARFLAESPRSPVAARIRSTCASP